MSAVSLEELRELALRSRRAQRWGFLSLALALLLFPLQLVLAQWMRGEIAAVAALAAGGALLVRYAYLAGEERGAFRKVFRRLAQERRTRTLVVEVPAAPLVVEAR
jgi:phage-related minor tail protein